MMQCHAVCLGEFVLLGCDGFWTRYTAQGAATFVRARLWAGTSWCGGVGHAWTLDKVMLRGMEEDGRDGAAASHVRRRKDVGRTPEGRPPLVTH